MYFIGVKLQKYTTSHNVRKIALDGELSGEMIVKTTRRRINPSKVVDNDHILGFYKIYNQSNASFAKRQNQDLFSDYSNFKNASILAANRNLPFGDGFESNKTTRIQNFEKQKSSKLGALSKSFTGKEDLQTEGHSLPLINLKNYNKVGYY